MCEMAYFRTPNDLKDLRPAPRNRSFSLGERILSFLPVFPPRQGPKRKGAKSTAEGARGGRCAARRLGNGAAGSNRWAGESIRRTPYETFCIQLETRVNFFYFFARNPLFGRINPRKSKLFCVVLFGFAWKEFAHGLNPQRSPSRRLAFTARRAGLKAPRYAPFDA
jgi:hypothetical protein